MKKTIYALCTTVFLSVIGQVQASENKPNIFIQSRVTADPYLLTAVKAAEENLQAARELLNLAKEAAKSAAAIEDPQARARAQQAAANDQRLANSAIAKAAADKVRVEEALYEATKYSTGLRKKYTVALTEALVSWFPCAAVFTQIAIEEQLSLERQVQILGMDGEAAQARLAELGNTLGIRDYLVNLIIDPMTDRRNNVYIQADYRQKTGQPLASITGTVNDDPSDAEVRAGVDQFVEKLSYHEVCPYLGKVTVAVTSKKELAPRKVEQSAYCNDREGVFEKSSRSTSWTDQTWALERTGRISASGSADYQEFKEDEDEETDDCHRCAGTENQVKRTYIRRRTEKKTVNGLESSTVALRFGREGDEVDKFFITIKAKAAMGQQLTKNYERATGECDRVDSDPPWDKSEVEVAFGRSGVEFGPFDGSPREKRLVVSKKEIKATDPVTEEETVFTIDMDLRQEGSR